MASIGRASAQVVLLIAWCALLGVSGCATSLERRGSPTVRSGEPSATAAEKGARDWQRPPGPIAGQWQVTCERSRGLTVEFVVEQDGKTAEGRVVDPGAATKYGYHAGEVVLRLQANDFGNWRGKLKWRNVLGTQRWDPIYFAVVDDRLTATMTTCDCYKALTRVR